MPSVVQKDVSKFAFTADQISHIKKFSVERQRLAYPSFLIVEDQDFSRGILEGMLKKSNYEVYSATNAQEGLALYAEHCPCITLLDVELPDSNGHDVAAYIKQHDPDSFIVMVTGNHYQHDVMRARENKVQGFIAKPYGKQKITECIERYLRERKNSQQFSAKK